MDASSAPSTGYLCDHVSPPPILDGLQVAAFRGVAHENARAHRLVGPSAAGVTLPGKQLLDRLFPLS